MQVVLKRENNMINIAPMGSGKTLTFWMPLLFWENGIQIVVTPLNTLGMQNKQELARVGVHVMAIRAETATPQVFCMSQGENSLNRAVLTIILHRILPRGSTM